MRAVAERDGDDPLDAAAAAAARGLPPGSQRRPGYLYRGRLAGHVDRAEPAGHESAHLLPRATRSHGAGACRRRWVTPSTFAKTARFPCPWSIRFPSKGKSIAEADKAIREAYFRGQILRPGRQRIIVSLMQPRTTRVMVFRQEIGGLTIRAGRIRRREHQTGKRQYVNLRAYENDVLTALAETGGLASLEDYSEVVVFKHGPTTPLVEASLQVLPPGKKPNALFSLSPQTIVIPTRLLPGQPLPFRPQDVLLEDGDVVFLEARDTQLFYTGGLLPATEQVLPRDYDLDVVTAVMKVQGSLVNGGFFQWHERRGPGAARTGQSLAEPVERHTANVPTAARWSSGSI